MQMELERVTSDYSQPLAPSALLPEVCVLRLRLLVFHNIGRDIALTICPWGRLGSLLVNL